MIENLISKIHGKFPYEYLDDRHLLINVDSLEIMKYIEDHSIDLILTDPPYEFISKSTQGGGFYTNYNKRHLDNIKNSFGMSFEPSPFFETIKTKCKKFNSYIFTNKTLLKKYIDFAETNNFKWEILIWKKTNPLPVTNGHYLFDKEYIMYIKQSGALFINGLPFETYKTIKELSAGNTGNKTSNHPTEKPLKLLYNYIFISSNENDIVLDPYSGSFTTTIACIKTKRKSIGIELNPEYYELGVKRARQELSQGELFS